LPAFAEIGAVPYPPDWSALHHVFEGGWMWVLRFDTHRVSAGFACEDWLATELRLDDPEAAWDRFLNRFPSVREQFGGAVPVRPWVHARRLSFRMERVAGFSDHGAPWALLPSAAGFIDPLYSTGFSLTLAGIERLGRLLEDGIPGRESLEDWAGSVARDRDWVAEFIAGNYAAFGDFPRFVDTSQFYFAAASFTEMARRLGNPERAPGVLLSGVDAFKETFRRWRGTPGASVAEAIAPWNVAGLADASKGNAYGVDLGDVIGNAHKLGWDREDLRAEIARAPWARCEPEPHL
jgi:FADH2 O2-dependent halogenase